MKVLFVNTYAHAGGASIAATRLLKALNNGGINGYMVVQDKKTSHNNIITIQSNWRTVWNFVWERFIIWATNLFNRERIFTVDIANTGIDITQLPEFIEADIIHIHWINQGMLSIKSIKKILEAN